MVLRIDQVTGTLSVAADQGTVALVAQNDGNVVFYRDRDGRAVWSTRGGRTY